MLLLLLPLDDMEFLMNRLKSQPSASAIFSTKLGWIGVIAAESGIERLHFGHRTKKDVLEKISAEGPIPDGALPKWWKKAQKLLVAYAAGEAVDLSEIPIVDSQRTPFQERVANCLQKIGYGQTITYGELARRAGSAGAARAVGNQMAKNCVPLIRPCHRVVGSGGKLGGFSAPQGLTMKLRLLEMENVDCQQYSPTSGR